MRPAEYIYALVDPRSDAPFYIGRSLGPERRVYIHLSNCASVPVKAWVDEIRAAGLEPTWGILEETKDGCTAERQWVQRCLAKGIVLANSFKTNKYRADPEELMAGAITLSHSRVKSPTRKGPEGEQSQVIVRGMPVEYSDQMRAAANSLPGPRSHRLKRAYTEAIGTLLDSAEGSRDGIQLLRLSDGGAGKIVWIPIDLADRLDSYCVSMAFKNRFLITAVNRYLKSKDQL